MHEQGRDWSWAPAGVVLASCVVVPCIFWTRIEAVFVVPKLGALWAALAIEWRTHRCVRSRIAQDAT